MLIPENSYTHTCSCGTEFLAPKGSLHCHNCLYSEIESLRAQVESKWISVEDRLPDDGVKVLIYHTGISRKSGFEDMQWAAKRWSIDNPFRFAYIYQTVFLGKKWTVYFNYNGAPYTADDVTHWMPLPKPPTKGE